MQVIEHILTLKEEEKLMALGLLWAWWDARNKVNAGEQLKPVKILCTRPGLLLMWVMLFQLLSFLV